MIYDPNRTARESAEAKLAQVQKDIVATEAELRESQRTLKAKLGQLRESSTHWERSVAVNGVGFLREAHAFGQLLDQCRSEASAHRRTQEVDRINIFRTRLQNLWPQFETHTVDARAALHRLIQEFKAPVAQQQPEQQPAFV